MPKIEVEIDEETYNWLEQLVNEYYKEVFYVGVDKKVKSYECSSIEMATSIICKLLNEEGYNANIYIHKTLVPKNKEE